LSPEVLAAFIATCILLGLTPGPNMSLILASTLTSGLRAGLLTLAGTTTGLALLVGAAPAGLSSVLVFMSDWFAVIRCIGALYLVYLGARQLWAFWQRGAPGTLPPRRACGANLYFDGLLVSLSNPKVLLFLTAFLPQFVDPRLDLTRQLAVLALLFIAVLVLVDVAFTLAAARARTAFGRLQPAPDRRGRRDHAAARRAGAGAGAAAVIARG